MNLTNKELICIDDSIKPEQVEWKLKHCTNWVKKGETYTIRKVTNHDNIVEGFLLNEIYNKESFNVFLNRNIEPHFAKWRFKILENQPNEIEESEFELTKEKVSIIKNNILELLKLNTDENILLNILKSDYPEKTNHELTDTINSVKLYCYEDLELENRKQYLMNTEYNF